MSKKVEIYALLVDRLVGAHYRFGDRILVKDVVEETGASRQPVMSALGWLEADGFVQIVPQVGCEVIDPSGEAISDFYLMFGELEALLASLAAERRTDEQLTELRNDQREMNTIEAADPNGAAKYARANRRFHETLHTMSASHLVADRQRRNFNMSDFFIAQAIGFDRLVDATRDEHVEIIEAVAAREADRAAAAARQHIVSIARRIKAAE